MRRNARSGSVGQEESDETSEEREPFQSQRAREGGWGRRSGRKSVSDAQGRVDLGPGDRNTCLRQ